MSENRETNLPGEEENSSVFYLTDPQGKEYPFELLDIIDYEGGQYAVFFPLEEAEDDSDDTEVVILRVTAKDDGSAEFDGIDDEAVLDGVFQQFMRNMRDAFDADNPDPGYGE